MNRPIHVPDDRKGLIYAVRAPLTVSGVALLGSNRFGMRWGPVAPLLGLPVYLQMSRVQPTSSKRTT